MPAIAQLSHVTLRYDKTVALNDVSLEVARGTWVCVLGANGSGKSTLASVLTGLLAPDEGSVALVGNEVLVNGIVNASAYRAARRRLGLVFQNPDDQIVTTVVADDVAFGPENLGVDPKEIGQRVEYELKTVAMQDYAQSDPTRLSGGQKQRVAIAGALAMHPDLLVLDEPGALLDVRGRSAILRVMGRLRTAGTTLLHITHFMDEALAADRVLVMDHGMIVLDGTPAEVFARVDELRSLGLEEPFAARLSEALGARGVNVTWTCNEDELRRAIAAAFASANTDSDAVASGGTPFATRGGAQTSPDPLVAKGVLPESTETALSVSHVSYTYRDTEDRPALRDVSFSVLTGQTTAIVGQTGSGKSTLLRLLCALEQPDSGVVLVDSISTRKRRDRRRLRHIVGYVMQHPERQLFAETVHDDVAYGPRNLGLSESEVETRVTHALELVGLLHKVQASPFELSGGQQRLCALAGVLAMEPRILVLDEPTAGLDPRGRSQLRAILSNVAAHGVTLIEVTHAMEAAAAAEQVVMLNQAHLQLLGTPTEVFSAKNEQMLRESGLGLPEALAFALKLEADGMPELDNPLSLDELADALATRLAQRPSSSVQPSENDSPSERR